MVFCFVLIQFVRADNKIINTKKTDTTSEESPIPCTCGVFLSGQFKKGSKEQPKGVPVLTQEMDTPFMNNSVGNRQCTNKCLESVRTLTFIFYIVFVVSKLWFCPSLLG